MILVVADDFSGAAEIAGVASRFGLTAEVQTEPFGWSFSDVLIWDSNTRSASVAKVRESLRSLIAVYRTLRNHPHSKIDLIFKKVDSVLRGHVSIELAELRRGLGFEQTLLIHANPRKGRMVEDGILTIDGIPIVETDFRNDPEFPATTSHVIELMRSSEDPCCLISRMRGAVEALSQASQPTIAIGCCTSESELRDYASCRPSQWLLAGAAEFFEAVLESKLKMSPSENQRELASPDHTILIQGSSMGGKIADMGFPVFSFRDDLSWERNQDMAIEAFLCRGRLAICDERSNLPATHHPPLCDAGPSQSLPPPFEHFLERAAAIVRRIQPQALWIEGGRTASQLVRTLEWNRFEVKECYGDGIVSLRPIHSETPSLLVKPGSYPWPVAKTKANSKTQG